MKLKMDFSSDIKFLEAVKSIFDNFLKLAKIENEDIAYWTWVAANEGLVNAIKHGNKQNNNLNVKFEIEFIDNTLTLKISDKGKGFKVEEVKDPTKPENLLKSSGRGLLFMKNIMDTVEFDRTDDNFTIILKKGVVSA